MFLPRSVARSKRSSTAAHLRGTVKEEDGRAMNTVTVVDLRAPASPTRVEEEEEEEEVCKSEVSFIGPPLQKQFA